MGRGSALCATENDNKDEKCPAVVITYAINRIIYLSSFMLSGDKLRMIYNFYLELDSA